MGEVLNVVGLLVGGLTMIPFLSQLFAPNHDSDTSVRIVLGSSVDGSASMSGNTPGVGLWDFNGSAIGYTNGKKQVIPQGNFADIKVTPRKEAGNIQAQYIAITNGGIDAICIAGISVTFPDGAKAAFSTNVAAACGGFWANSNTPVLDKQASPELENPKCVWIDRDASNGITTQGMGIHLPSFSGSAKALAAEYSKNRDTMCKSGPRFRLYDQLKTEDSILVFPHPPEFIHDGNDTSQIGADKDIGFIINNPGIQAANLKTGKFSKRSRRDTTQNTPALANTTISTPSSTDSLGGPLASHVIISPNDFNSARELCESDTSYGHSFVSTHENLFCDMTDKTLYYTCDGKVTDCCFDQKQGSFLACKPQSARPLSGTFATGANSAKFRRAEPIDASLKDGKDFGKVIRW